MGTLRALPIPRAVAVRMMGGLRKDGNQKIKSLLGPLNAALFVFFVYDHPPYRPNRLVIFPQLNSYNIVYRFLLVFVKYPGYIRTAIKKSPPQKGGMDTLHPAAFIIGSIRHDLARRPAAKCLSDPSYIVAMAKSD